MKRWNSGRALLFAVMAAAGCATVPTTHPVNQSGYSTAFREGYAAGCDSVGAHRPRRDEARYKADADYMMGWNDGFSICEKRR